MIKAAEHSSLPRQMLLLDALNGEFWLLVARHGAWLQEPIFERECWNVCRYIHLPTMLKVDGQARG
jgi:hypothetical protein